MRDFIGPTFGIINYLFGTYLPLHFICTSVSDDNRKTSLTYMIKGTNNQPANAVPNELIGKPFICLIEIKS